MSAYAATTDPTAVSGRRFGAYVVDGIVVAALSIGLFFATAGVTLWEKPATCAQLEAAGEVPSSRTCTDDIDVTIGDDEYGAATYRPIAWAIAGAASFAYLILVQWFLQAATGLTLGKAIFGIRTVDENGGAPGIGKQFIRGILWIVDGLCNGLVAAILILVTKGHRRLGDMAAKTFVVRSSAKGSPILVPGMEGQPAPTYTGAGTAGYAPPASGATPSTPPTPGTAQAQPTETAQAAQQPTGGTGGATGQPSASGPQWDASRNAYIQWDPSGNRWLTYDDAAGQWKPLEGEQPPPPPA